jgi:MFS family permease
MNKHLNPKIITYLYLVVLLTYLCCQIDTGIFAVANDAMIKYLGDISESDMGLLATALYIGNVVGAVFCPLLFSKVNAKYILIVSAIMNGLFVSVFAFTSDFWIVFGSRVIVGVFEVMFEIYFPVWVDLHAPKKLQTMWISFLIVITPLGLIFGYVVTNVLMGSD